MSNNASGGDILGLVSFGDWLRQERTRQKLGVNELARRAILSPATITRLESGELKAPSQATVQKLARALHVRYETIDAVVRGVDWVFVDGPENLPPEIREIEDLLKGLSLEDRRDILLYVRWRSEQRDK